MTNVSRRKFIAATAGAGVLSVFGCGRNDAAPFPVAEFKSPFKNQISVVRSKDIAKQVTAAIDNLGGIGKIVKKGSRVVVKPNIGWDRSPEQAANTHPEVVKTLVKLCLAAGAASVSVFDRTCDDRRRTYENSGIAAAVKAAGGKLKFFEESSCVDTPFPAVTGIKSWPVHREILEADVLINCPVAKHHGSAKLTLGMKNYMGVVGGNRGKWHGSFDKYLAGVNLVRRPDLIVIDATRILLKHGPQGGNLEDVKKTETVIAGIDPVAVDAYACRLFNVGPNEIAYLTFGVKAGLGAMKREIVETVV